MHTFIPLTGRILPCCIDTVSCQSNNCHRSSDCEKGTKWFRGIWTKTISSKSNKTLARLSQQKWSSIRNKMPTDQHNIPEKTISERFISLWYCLRLLPASVSGMLKWGCSAALTILRNILLRSPNFELIGMGASIPISWLTYKSKIALIICKNSLGPKGCYYQIQYNNTLS